VGSLHTARMNKLIGLVALVVAAGCGVDSAAVVAGDGLTGPTADVAETEQGLTIANYLPLRAGNGWTLEDGTSTRTLRVTRASGTVHLVEGFGSAPAWMAFAGTRLWIWNQGAAKWETFVNFRSNAETQFSMGSPCEQFTVTPVRGTVSLTTPAGTFTAAKRYQFTVRPPPYVRCAQPPFSSLTFAENAGLVELGMADGRTFSLTRATVSGRTYPMPTVKASLTTDAAQVQLGADGTATIRATYHLRNETSQPVTFQFSSGQQFQLEVTNASGDILYVWSATRRFTGALSTFTLQPGASKTTNDTITLHGVPAGWLVVKAWLPTRMGETFEASTKVELLAAPASCFIGGCSGQVCSDGQDVVTSCEARPEYVCYRQTVCERQADGQCGWTMTPAVRQCLGR